MRPDYDKYIPMLDEYDMTQKAQRNLQSAEQILHSSYTAENA